MRFLAKSLKLSKKEVTWEQLRTHGQHPKEATKVSILDFLLILLPLGQIFSKSDDEKAFPRLKELLTRLPEGCPLNLEVRCSINILEKKIVKQTTFPRQLKYGQTMLDGSEKMKVD